MAQVLTNENMSGFLETGKVPEFVKPEAEKPKAKPADTGVAQPKASTDAKSDAQSGKKPAADANTESESDKLARASEHDDPADDVEGDDGLTPRQKRDLTAKMLKAVGAKHKALKKAEAFAESQSNERRLAEKRADALQAEIDQIKAQLTPQSASEGQRPTRGAYTTQEDYEDALIDWGHSQREKRRAQDQAKKEREEREASFKKRIDGAFEKYPDFQELIDQHGESSIPGHISEFLIESDIGEEIAYTFAKDPKILERLSKLSPVKAIAELGKLEASISKDEPEKPADTTLASLSRAPKPITPVSETATPLPPDPEKMNADQLHEFRRKERAKAAREGRRA